ncbi:atrial natriuretic peptide-converting enzyme isoform X4 [Pieris brassicae]|uniref:atrial natriuretic peptide-converting enzyme isoform X4 n=1 Tax=Pieris brassicae TaxID=7116 RepID=UPI001E660C24|nr:atrial natriuretic peptide-converting enzyme isoform X4 [Pieris brassicae]
MVNGNYVLYGDSPASESEIVDDHVHRKTVERKEKRKSNRSANDLQRSLNLAQKLDNETDSDKFEKKIKEPRLLRYVPTTEVQEHFVAEKFETYDLKPMEEPMKRYTFAKKPKNHADGSINYAYSRSSSSCSSPNGNLPTISEHGEQYGTYRIRSIQTSSNEGIGEYQTKLDKYFTSPRDVKSFTDKGSHPDSLYRVPSDRGRNTRKIVHMLRLLRWPVALFGVCVALAIFVYFLMPDNLGQEFDKINATNWEENFSSAQSYTTTSSKSGPLNRNISKSVNVPQCRSTRLSLCRGILPYDLAGLPARIGKKEVTLLLPQIKYLVATNCSDRVRHFACSLLEPECSPPPFSSKLPCYSLCKAIADRCEGYIPTELSPIFNCNQYSSSNCVNARSPCFDRELTCGDGTCVPRDWICDGTRDCPGGEDEAPCSTCEENEFRCQSGLCIVKRWVCDGYSDCPDGDDEIDESCRSHTNGEVQEPGEELAGSAPAPSIRKPYRQPQSRHYNGETDSKELLMTSDTTNALKRNFTRRPSPSRLTPYSRPMLRSRKEPEPTTMENLTEKPAASYRKNFRKQTQRVPESKKDLSEDMDQFYVDVIKEDERTVETPPPVATKLDKSIDNLERVIDGAELLRKAALARKQDLSRELNATEEDFGYNSAHASPCPNEELRCVDGRCITLAQLCDGTIDCSDHADEDNCYT